MYIQPNYDRKPIGRCSICYGDVVINSFINSVPTCTSCGAIKKSSLPIIPMEKVKPTQKDDYYKDLLKNSLPTLDDILKARLEKSFYVDNDKLSQIYSKERPPKVNGPDIVKVLGG